MKIFVQLDSGEIFETRAKSSESLQAVKKAVEAQTNVPPEKQRLYFGGTELLDAQTLAHSLWDALKKVAGAEAEDGKLDLRTVKQLCSPATSPRSRGMSPVRSGLDLLSLTQGSGEGAGGGVTTSTLNAVAAKLGPDGDRGVSPHRRMAANRLAAQHLVNRSFEEDVVSPEFPSSPIFGRGGGGANLGPLAPQLEAQGEGAPVEGFTGYHDDMIL